MKISGAASVKLNTWCRSVTVSFLAPYFGTVSFLSLSSSLLAFSQDAACHPKGKEWKSQCSRGRSWDISGWRSVLKSYNFLHLAVPMYFLLPLHPLCLICFSMHLNCVFCLSLHTSCLYNIDPDGKNCFAVLQIPGHCTCNLHSLMNRCVWMTQLCGM